LRKMRARVDIIQLFQDYIVPHTSGTAKSS
jgi:hypothetical protein